MNKQSQQTWRKDPLAQPTDEPIKERKDNIRPCPMYVTGNHHFERKKQYVPAVNGLPAVWWAGIPVCKCGLEDDTKEPIYISGKPEEVDELFLKAISQQSDKEEA